MISSKRKLLIRAFTAADAEPVAVLLRSSELGYLQYFRPFAYEGPAIAALVSRALDDQWFLLETIEGGVVRPAGFYMLRGLDEGFADPMYGVFVAAEFARCGLGRLTLAHAEAQCRLNGWGTLLLKVNPKNTRAFQMYESAGFRFLRRDDKHGEHVLAKTLTR